MLNRLIAVRIITHIHDLHFPNLMDSKAVITIIKKRRHRKDRIQLIDKCFISSHQINKSLHIVENTPSVMNSITFGEDSAPFIRREGLFPISLLSAPSHPSTRIIVEITIIQTTLFE